MLIIIFLFLQISCTSSGGFRQATDEELNLYHFAVKSSNYSICYQFDPLAKNLPLDAFDYSTERIHLRNDCFFNIAVKLRNPDLCRKMELVSPYRNYYKTTNEELKNQGFNVVSEDEVFQAYMNSCIEKASNNY